MIIQPCATRCVLMFLCAVSVLALPAHAQQLDQPPARSLAPSNHPSSPTTPDRGTASITRGPYLQLATPHSIIVRWDTDAPTDSRVQFGLGVGQLTQSVDDPAPTTEHTVTLTGLTPDTEYFYAVGSSDHVLAGDSPEYHLSTAPPVGSQRPVRIWAIGDSGTGDHKARAVRDAYLAHTLSTPTDVWLMLGDNAYLLGSDTDYQNAVFDTYPSILRTTTLWPALGNHDAFSSHAKTQTGPYYDIFSLPDQAQAGGVPSNTEAYYSFDYANIHFVNLDSSGLDREIGGPMLTWLAADVAATTQDWIIAYFHNPPYSRGHNSDTDPGSIDMRRNAMPILEAAGVDLVLSGHSHSYERSYLLDGHYGLSDTLDPSMILDEGDGQIGRDGAYHKPDAGLAPHQGTVYAVSGSAGMVTGDSLGHPVMHASIIELGSMVIDVHAHRLSAIFLNSAGEIGDHFTITKGPQPCVADFNADTLLNFFDVSAYLVAYSDNDPGADLDANGALNFFDVSMFLTAYAQGCP